MAIDANFRLKLKARGVNDPELGSGWAYFVEQLDYAEHVKKFFGDKDVGLILSHQDHTDEFSARYEHADRPSALSVMLAPNSLKATLSQVLGLLSVRATTLYKRMVLEIFSVENGR